MEGVTYERSRGENVEALRWLDLGLDPNTANSEGRTALMGAALKGRNEAIQLLVDRGARLDLRDHGSRDTDKIGSAAAGHTWQAIDYADGLVRAGVQGAIAYPETSAFIRKLMIERGSRCHRTATSSPCAAYRLFRAVTPAPQRTHFPRDSHSRRRQAGAADAGDVGPALRTKSRSPVAGGRRGHHEPVRPGAATPRQCSGGKSRERARYCLR